MAQYSGMWTLSQVSQAVKNQTWAGLPPSVVEYLVVGGGGSGGGNRGLGGGGGAGGLLAGYVGIIPGSSYFVTVGAGGVDSAAANGGVGGNSVLIAASSGATTGNIVAFGGGTGAEAGVTGYSGASGGGGSNGSPNGYTGGNGIAGQGNAGGYGYFGGSPYGSGGGGGAGTKGLDVYAGLGFGANGGAGVASSISGSVVVYAGGGGGTSTSVSAINSGRGGVGGGGDGNGNNAIGYPGSVNSGGGGGGGYGGSPQGGGNGGSGVVIVRYPGTTQFFTGGTLSYANGYIIHTFYANGVLAPTTPTLYTNPDYQIARSIRMNQADNALFTRTVGGSGNRRTWTWSGWVKRSLLQTTTTDYLPMLFTSTDQSSGSAYLQFGLYGDSAGINSLNFNDQAGGSYNATTSAVFRDTSAWYHIVCAYDTTQNVSTDRVKLYVNGVKQALTAGSTFQTQNAEGYFNYSSFQHKIGGYGGAVQMHQFAGYMAEVNFIDGQALTPSSFGWTNPTTGVWAPIKYVGTYGTNGFYVNFSDNSNTTAATLGADSSGNGNNWSPNNFSVSAGAGNDSLVDTPTLYGTDTGVGGEVRGNYCTLNPLDKSTTGGATSNGNLDYAGTQTSWDMIRSTFGISSGKWYWEVSVNSSTYGITGIAQASVVLQNNYFNSGACLGYNASNGDKYSGTGGATAYGASWNASNDICGVAFDADAGTLTFYKNGVSQGVAYTSLSGTYFPTHTLYHTSTATMNFGQRPFAYTAPTGFKALCTQNLPTPTIGATTATQAGKYFGATAYSGTSATQAIVNDGFQPDLIWLKARNAVGDNGLYDSIRGISLRLVANNTNAEASVPLDSFNSNGFSTTSNYNNSGQTLIAWQWRASNATAVSNTSGSITSTVSASTTSGFSIVTWTNPTSGVFTFGHGLGVAPSVVFFKDRQFPVSWTVYHIGIGNTGAVFLNDTQAVSTSSGYFNNTSPTSTVVTANQAGVGTGNANMVAYCFAPIAGYSAFGSYTGNGSADGPMIFTGFRPAFIMIKRTSSSGTNWQILDTKRSTYNVMADYLYASAANAEGYDTNVGIDSLSNGFKIRGTDGNTNTNTATYIYMAFAENPFKYSLAR